MSSKFGALAAAPVDKEADKGRVGQTRVRRYRAGVVPEFAKEQQLQDLQITDRDVVRTEIAAPVIVRKADPRLARLAALRSEDVDDVREQHREIRAAEIVRRRRTESSEEPEDADQLRRRRREISTEPGSEEAQGEASSDDEPGHRRRIQSEEQEEDEEELERRRQAVRARLLAQQREQEALLAQQQAQNEDSEEEEEEDSSEYETDSEDEAYAGRKLLKPVFVPKTARETIAEREKLEEEEKALLEYEEKRKQERKLETREIVKATVELEEAQAKAAAESGPGNTAADWNDINTDDDQEDETAEFEAWKTRELGRIRLQRMEKERLEREQEERERLKNMTEEERRAYEAANAKQPVAKDKKKWNFLQKYWHKGAFFQESADDLRGTTDIDPIFNRDYSAPTGEDKFNKEMLPKVMQVKNFGRSGRTKWTHLLAEDTSQLVAPLAQFTDKDKKRAGGVGAPDEFFKPKKTRT